MGPYGSPGVMGGSSPLESEISQLWPWLLVITGYFYGIIHSINVVFLVLITGITWAITAEGK